MPALLLELVETLGWVAKLPPWLTMLGVTYLVVMSRRQARRQTALEHTTQLLVDGHRGDVGAHQQLAAKLAKRSHHA